MSEPALRFSGLDLDDDVIAALRGRAAADGRAHRDRGNGRGAQLHPRVQRPNGPDHRERGADGARRLPDDWRCVRRIPIRPRRCRPHWTGPTSSDAARPARVAPMDALLSAYRVGARSPGGSCRRRASTPDCRRRPSRDSPSWSSRSSTNCRRPASPGHADELATTGRVRQRYLERLAQQLLSGETAETLRASAEKADWRPPETLTAVLRPRSANPWSGSTFRAIDVAAQRGPTRHRPVRVTGAAAGSRSGRPAPKPAPGGIAGQAGVGGARAPLDVGPVVVSACAAGTRPHRRR